MAESTFSRCGPKIDMSVLESLEQELGARLPEDYRQFLQANNGGTPERGYFAIEGREDCIWIDYLLQLDGFLSGVAGRSSGADSYTTIASWQARFAVPSARTGRGYGNIIPEGTLVIGVVGRDDPLLLYYRGERRGQVYWKSLQELPFPPNQRWEREPELGLHFVAPSFTGFLGMLQGEQSTPDANIHMTAKDPKRASRAGRKGRHGARQDGHGPRT